MGTSADRRPALARPGIGPAGTRESCCPLTQQAAIGQGRERIHTLEKLWFAGQSPGEEVDGFGPREEVDVRDRVSRQISARPVAADARCRNERRAGLRDTPATLSGHDQVIRRSEKLINSGVQHPQQHGSGRVVVGDQGGIRLRRWSWRRLQSGNLLPVGIHGVEPWQIARCMPRKPHQSIGHESRTGRERVVGKQLEQVRHPADRVPPALRRCQRGSFVRRSYEYGAPKLEAPRESSEGIATLHEVTQDKSSTRVRDYIERGGLVGQALEKHAGIFFGRAAEGEVIEGKDAFAIRLLHAIEESGCCQRAIRRRGV
jgi:hypothetical protein